MRKPILLPFLLAACSGDSGPGPYRVVPDLLETAVAVSCAPADLGDVSVHQLRVASDTSVLILDAAQRRLTEMSDDLRPLWTLEYVEHGPAGVQRPAAATLVGDSAVAIVTRDGLRLLILDRDGELGDAHRLHFVPASVTAAGSELLVTAVPMGPTPDALVFRVHDGGLESIPVPPRPYDDMIVGALGNQTLAEALPDGSALVVHQFLAPRAFRVDARVPEVWPLRMPTPDATVSQIGYLPRPPLTRDQYRDMLVPAIAMSVDRSRGEVYLLTRSGREVNGRFERVLFRVNDSLEPIAAYTLDAHAVHMAFLSRRRAALVADDLDRFYLCPIGTDAHVE